MRALLLFLLLPFLPLQGFAAVPDVQTAAKQAIAIDYDTGAVLFTHNADMRMPTSSMSKVLSMYVVFDALKQQTIKLEDTLHVSEKAWRKGGSKMFVENGSRVPVEDLVRGVIIQSGNDATIVLAEGLAGSEDAFARRLNDTAHALGMHNSHFTNASGWPDPEHYSTARDLSLLARALIQNFPDYYHYYAEQTFTFNNIKQANRNPLIYRNIGADGIKTGHTEAGGYGLIGSGTRFGRRAIIVINGLPDETARARESARLLNWALDHFENKTLFKAGYAVSDAPVLMGKDKTVRGVLRDDITVTYPKTAPDDLETTVKFHENLEAPVQENQEIGAFTITIPGQIPVQKPIYAEASVERVGMIKGAFIKLNLFVKDQIKTYLEPDA